MCGSGVARPGYGANPRMEHPQLPLGLTLRESACFASYFPGDNHEAVNSLRLAAQGAGEVLVYLAAPPGLGKTHLLQAACQEAADCARTAVYLPLRHLAGMSPALFDALERMDLVCVDDVEAVATRPVWERGLFDLFNRLRESGSTLLVTGEKRPDRTCIQLADLVSRLGWGVTYVLKPLDEGALFTAITYRAKARGLELPEDTARFLLRHFPRDLTSLCSLLDRLDRASLVTRRRLTIPFVKAALAGEQAPQGC
jgi:DnaA family protein